MRGTISEAGTLDAAGIELLKNAEGERMTVFVKVLDKSDNSSIGLTFQFFVNVTPNIILGNITQGKKPDKKNNNLHLMIQSLIKARKTLLKVDIS